MGQGRSLCFSSGHRAHDIINPCDDPPSLDVARHNHRQVPGIIMFLYVRQYLVAAEVIYGLFIADDRKPIRVFGVRCCHQLMEQHDIGPVITHGNLFQNNFFLAFHFKRIKDRVHDCFSQHLKCHVPLDCRKGGMIDRVFIRGIGIYPPTDPFNGPGQLTGSPCFRALKNHVFYKMGDACLLCIFINGPGFDPDLYRCHSCSRHLFDKDGQAIIQSCFMKVRGQFFRRHG